MHARKRLAGMLIPLGALILAVVQIAIPAGSAHAASTSHAAGPVVDQPGTAAAGANLLGVSPGVSGLTLTTTIGESEAALQHDEAQAKSATLDLGSLGLVLATTTFCGVSSLPESRQPQPLKADSDTGPHHASMSTAGPAGKETVSAIPAPESASATTTSVEQSLPGVFAITGNSTAQVHFVKGQGQHATSTVNENLSLLGGLVKFDGMTWQATRAAGTSSTRSTSFSFGKVTLGGVPVKAPSDAPGKTIASVNQVLAPFGLTLLQPQRSTNERTGAVSIGPMTLRFRGSSIERTLVSPVVNAVISLEDLIAKHSTAGSNCADFRQLLFNVGTNVETLLNVGLAISEGAGVLDFDFGGATASARTAAEFNSPFGGGGPTDPTGAGHSPPIASRPASPSQNHQLPQAAGAGTGSTPSGSGPTVAAPDATNTATTIICRSTSDAGSQHCWRGLATVASGAALVVGAGLLGLDLYSTRRRRPLLRRRYRRV